MKSIDKLMAVIFGSIAVIGVSPPFKTSLASSPHAQGCQNQEALNAGQALPCVYAGRRSGTVKLANRTFVDDQGPFLGFGTTLFWAHWGYIHDRPKLEAHLKFL